MDARFARAGFVVAWAAVLPSACSSSKDAENDQHTGGSSQGGAAMVYGGSAGALDYDGGANQGGRLANSGGAQAAAGEPGAGGASASSGGAAKGGEFASGGGGAAGAAEIGGEPNAGASSEDGTTTLGSVAEDADCDAQVSSNPPVVGLGSLNSAQSYDAVVGRLMMDYGVPGGAIAVSYAGRLVLARAYGFANQEQRQPAHPAQLFRVASLSKQLTAIAILQLAEAGKLSLDAPAFAYLPSLAPLPGKTKNPALSSITVRHLLNHTGGWNRGSEAVGDPMFASRAIANELAEPGPATASDTIRYMLDKPLTYAPGTTYCYSNLGYAVLGAIIEQQTDTDYETYVNEHVAKPRHAVDLRIGGDLQADVADEEVSYYDYPGAPLTASIFPGAASPAPWPYGGFSMQAMKAHGGWIASPIDYLRITAGVDSFVSPPSLISASSLASMLANPQVPSCNADGSTTPASSAYWYGFGYQVNQYGNYWHTGSLPGTATENVVANNQYAFAAFFNTRPANADAFASDLDAALWVAFNGVDSWSSEDYFDQYGSLSDWMAPTTFARQRASASSAKNYASRVEGRQHGREVQYRAAFAPLHTAADAAVSVGLDCIAYQRALAEQAQAGRGLVSLQTFQDADGRTRYQGTWKSY